MDPGSPLPQGQQRNEENSVSPEEVLNILSNRVGKQALEVAALEALLQKKDKQIEGLLETIGALRAERAGSGGATG